MQPLDFIFIPVRSSAILTGSYVAGNIIGNTSEAKNAQLDNQCILNINFTKGNLTSGEVKIEFSFDGTTYAQETNSVVSGATSTDTLIEHTFAATGVYRIAFPIKERFIKVSAKGTGADATNSLMAITAVIGTV